MDSFWQQHRTFVLKILAGLAVILVCWIIGSSFNDKPLDEIAATNSSTRKSIQNMSVPSEADIGAFDSAVGKLEARVHNLAGKVGNVTPPAEFRRELIRKILILVEKGTPETIASYTRAANSNPKALVWDLNQDAREYLSRKAGLENVILTENLGGKVQPDESQVDRYLLAFETAIRVVKLAIDVRLYEVVDVDIDILAGSRFEDEERFIREFPVRVQVRGQAEGILEFLQKLNNPADFIPVAEVNVGQDRSERDPSVLTAKLKLTALRIDLGSQVEE